MAKHGFYASQLAIPPYLSHQEVTADCRDEILPATRRPGKTTSYLIAASDVEGYYRSKGFIPEEVTRVKLRELGFGRQEEAVRGLLNKLPESQRRRIMEEAGNR